MGTAVKNPAPDRVKSSFVIFDVRATAGHSHVQHWASECPDVKNYKWQLLNPVWRRMLYSCTHMATVSIKGLTGVRSPLDVSVCSESGPPLGSDQNCSNILWNVNPLLSVYLLGLIIVALHFTSVLIKCLVYASCTSDSLATYDAIEMCFDWLIEHPIMLCTTLS